MSNIKLEARVGYNDDDEWNVQMRVTHLASREDARELGQKMAQQFRDFLASHGVSITEDVVKKDTALILPDSMN